MSLSKEAVVEMMKQDHVVVLSVLPELEFEKLHIRGSRNLPLTPDHGAFTQAVEKQYGKERFFVVYGDDAVHHDALESAEILQRSGFKAEAYLGGIEAWNEAGLPTAGTLVSSLAGAAG